jgi:ABC-type polysaccharide/polyol phosphate export permease
MKTLINIGMIGLIIMYIFDQETYLNLEAPVVHVIHFLLVGYVVWILLSDLLKGLRRQISEKFGFTFKRIKRKFSKVKHQVLR